MGLRFFHLARTLAHRQAQVLFAVIFYGFVTPYALLLRLARRRSKASGGWCDVQDDVRRVEALRRTF
ncbi:MAG: hypothetical protein HY900_18690 [Deltaproteobacteria bacterium]|nr:hypothetical protein [Deltaproteobacteria bacterium]